MSKHPSDARVPRENPAGLSSLNPLGRPVIAGCVLVLFVFLAYLPAIQGTFVWDDDSWTTNLLPFSARPVRLGGDLDPSNHTAAVLSADRHEFLAGLSTLESLDDSLPRGEHPVARRVGVVVLAVVGSASVARRMAGERNRIFAVHPVLVESVAWVTERKNVLSLAPYLGALLVYGKYAQWETSMAGRTPTSGDTRGKNEQKFLYGVAFVLFLCALLAKTTAFSLPAVVLLIGWWKRGQIRWRADVMPMLPFFAAAICLSAVTGWLEKHHVGAQGAEFALTFSATLSGGRPFVLVFISAIYFGRRDFASVYPQWQPDPGLAVAMASFPGDSHCGPGRPLAGAWGRTGCGPATAMRSFLWGIFRFQCWAS